MSTIADFNRIDACEKIDAHCVDVSIEAKLDEDNPKLFRLETSWGDSIVDLSPAIKTEETLTTMYLSPDPDPNCLVYEPERGDNICIHGDDFSRIISMHFLKDVDQSQEVTNGIVYMYNDTTNLFEPYDLQAFIDSANLRIRILQEKVQALEQTVNDHEGRLQIIEELLTPPDGTPNGARLAWGNINSYADSSAVVNSSGTATTLDKTHGLYTHALDSTVYGDQIFG